MWTAALLCGGLLVLIAVFVFGEAAPLMMTPAGRRIFSGPGWYPLDGLYNLMPMITGTLWSSFGALLVATPLGLISALFCTFYAPAVLATAYRRLIEILAGVPSVVYGFWGLVVLVPVIGRWQPPGASLLAGVLILSIMVLPTVALTAMAAIEALPRAYLLNAEALGLRRWSKIWRVVLPAARAGIAGGVILAFARALGETMAVLMVTGNVVSHAEGVFDPIRTLTANIALEMSYALGSHRSALFVSGLLLLGVVVTLILLAEYFQRGVLRER